MSDENHGDDCPCDAVANEKCRICGAPATHQHLATYEYGDMGMLITEPMGIVYGCDAHPACPRTLVETVHGDGTVSRRWVSP